MRDPEYKEDEVEEAESTETTPAGSYRLPGQDVSGFLGVDNEYKNAATPGGEAILTEAEEYLYLPAPEDDEEDEDGESDEDDGDESEESDEERAKKDKDDMSKSDDEGAEKKDKDDGKGGAAPVVTPADPRVQTSPGPRPIL